MELTADTLLTFAAELQGEQWATLARRVPFRYQVTADGIEFVSEAGRPHPASRSEVAAFCDEFNREQSFSPGHYPSVIECPSGWFKSYLLALIRRFVRDQAGRSEPSLTADGTASRQSE